MIWYFYGTMIGEKINDFIKNETGEVIENSSGRFGDYCLVPGTLNKIAKQKNSTPADAASVIAAKLKDGFPEIIEKARFEAGYLNIYLTKAAYLEELSEINKNIDAYLADGKNKNRTIVFDYSSPNIAKPFSVGHLRSTIIGQANLNIHKALGYKTVGINHLGDWGTQFGKLIVAIKKWGNEDEIAKNPIEKLNGLYVKFHEEAEKDETLNDEAREWLRKLEEGDEEAKRIWQKCVDWSMAEFARIYKLLGVEIDNATGESFYIDKQQAVIAELKEKNLLKESEGAQIVELENLPPALIQKKDGATLYMTRDLAALKYRIEKYHPNEIIYHVGNDQSLHFQQLTAVAEKMGWLERSGNPECSQGGKTKITFAGHGMIRLPEGKMSTRAGRTVLLEDLLSEAKDRAMKIIVEKDSDADDRDKLAQDIAISAIKYADLSQNRKGDVVFSFDKMISLKGNSAPYLQYSLARLLSITRKAEEKFGSKDTIESISEESVPLAQKIIKIKHSLQIAAESSCPNLFSEYLFDLTNEFNSYYEKSQIITDDQDETLRNIYIISILQKVFEKSFDLLGLKKLEKI